MAFTTDQKLDISAILGVDRVTLDNQLNIYANEIDSATESKVIAQIALWNSGIGTENVKLHPTESNKGVETNPGADKGTIKSNIAVWLYFDLAALGGGGGQTRTVRG